MMEKMILPYNLEEVINLHNLYPDDSIHINLGDKVNSEITAYHKDVKISAPNIELLKSELSKSYKELK